MKLIETKQAAEQQNLKDLKRMQSKTNNDIKPKQDQDEEEEQYDEEGEEEYDEEGEEEDDAIPSKQVGQPPGRLGQPAQPPTKPGQPAPRR